MTMPAGARGDLRVATTAWEMGLASPAWPSDHRKAFTEVYRSRAWGDGSGPGSDPRTCGPYIEFVEKYLAEHSVKSVLDLGCGDGRLAKAIRWGDATYLGLDVVTGFDMRTDDLPDADLVLVKDVLQHWGNADIQAMLPRLADYPFVLITNTISKDVIGRPSNSDIAAGQWRPLDVSAHPFSWPVREVLRWELPHEVKAVAEVTAVNSPLLGS